MQNNVKINVTKLVDKVKEYNLLFYPVMMHIFAQALRVSGYKFIYSAYVNTYDDQQCILYQALEADFNAYFDTYVRNCFCNQPQGILPDGTILFYLDNFNQIGESYQTIPTFFMCELETINNEIFLPFHSKNIVLNSDFTDICEELAELF